MKICSNSSYFFCKKIGAHMVPLKIISSMLLTNPSTTYYVSLALKGGTLYGTCKDTRISHFSILELG